MTSEPCLYRRRNHSLCSHEDKQSLLKSHDQRWKDTSSQGRLLVRSTKLTVEYARKARMFCCCRPLTSCLLGGEGGRPLHSCPRSLGIPPAACCPLQNLGPQAQKQDPRSFSSYDMQDSSTIHVGPWSLAFQSKCRLL